MKNVIEIGGRERELGGGERELGGGSMKNGERENVPFAAVMNPDTVKLLTEADLPKLAEELRLEIVQTVAKHGGHLASSLGAVELAIALTRVFEPERDRILWDVGHQSYAWKLLTGRRNKFDTIRTLDGLSGFCNPEESECDAFVSGHAGSALAAAEGMAAARDLRGSNEHVVAVVGDASLANGESLEALNNCSSPRNTTLPIPVRPGRTE